MRISTHYASVRLITFCSFYSSKNERTYKSITRIESWRDSQSKRRHIVLKRPSGSSSQLFCCKSVVASLEDPADISVTRLERIIPHSEHPTAYESPAKLRIKFSEPCPLYSSMIAPSRRASEMSIMTSTPYTSGSSAASIRSFSSVGSPSTFGIDGHPQKEARQHEYEFENPEGLSTIRDPGGIS